MVDALQVRGLHHAYGAKPVLRGIDLALGADELMVILGATGAGKTTLLRAIAGLVIPDQGQVVVHGTDHTHSPPALRDVALVFQNFSLYPGWSVRRNLAFPLQAPGRLLSAEAITERVNWAAHLLRITELLDKPAERLSGGQMQRVAIGRALVRRPQVFLFDEPLTNLDAKLREALRLELVLLRRELRIPMLYVTHDRAEALSMADRIAVLTDGKIIQLGTPEAVWENPLTPDVAQLLGKGFPASVE